MQLFVDILVVGAILMAISMSSVEGRKDLFFHCKDLNKLMSQQAENFDDPKAIYELAHTLISPDHVLLDKAWKAVTNKEDCTLKSHEFVGAIFACGPRQYKSMKTLEQNGREYAKKCLSDPHRIDEILRTEMKALSSKDSKQLTQFLDDEFIATYRRYNPDDGDYFVLRFSCCWPLYCAKPVEEAMIRLPENKNKDVAIYYKQNPGKKESFLHERLSEPCEKYVKRMKHLMNSIEMLEKINFDEKNSWILEDLSEESKKAIFRYKLCDSLRGITTMKILGELVFPLVPLDHPYVEQWQ